MGFKHFKTMLMRASIRSSKTAKTRGKDSAMMSPEMSTASSHSTGELIGAIQQLDASPSKVQQHDPAPEESAEEDMEPYLDLVQDLIKCTNERDLAGIGRLVTDDLYYRFFDGSGQLVMELSLEDVAPEFNNTYQSFPDFAMTIQEVVSNAKNDAGTQVVAVRVVASGTHSGAPYSFAGCEPIPTSGKKLVNDPEEFHYHIKEGKVFRIEIHPKGELTGPAGFYTQLGTHKTKAVQLRSMKR